MFIKFTIFLPVIGKSFTKSVFAKVINQTLNVNEYFWRMFHNNFAISNTY